MKRALIGLPLLVAAALFTYVTGTPALMLIALLGLPLGLWLAPHVIVGRFLQSLAMAVVVVLGGLVGSGLLEGAPGIGPTELASIWGTLAMIAILLAVVRRFFREPLAGEKLDFALLTLAVAACGERRMGTGVYIVAAIAFVATGVAALRGREGAAPWRVVEGHGVRALLAMLAIAASFALASKLALPRIEEILQHRLENVIFAVVTAKTGFTDRLRLSSRPDPILESDEIVMRVYGPPTDYLRGQVYDHYEGGNWTWSKDLAAHEVHTATGRPDGARLNEIREVGDPSKREKRLHYFLPLGAHNLGTPHGTGIADPMGTLRPMEEERPSPVFFESRGGAAFLPVRAPTAEDLAVPPELLPTLAAFVADWTSGATTPRQKLTALETHLRMDFKYSLDGFHAEHGEPILVHFLRHAKQGHCEFFATAMAMLARQAGVPARVVGGYRVAEHNPVGDYDIVREKNAHAWVEAWIEGEGWRTFDATPPTLANDAHESTGLEAFIDAAASAWDHFADAIARASLWEILATLGAAVGALALARWLRARRAARALAAEGDAGAPLACFTRLEAELARRGVPRTASEALERYEERLREAELAEAAELVREYGAMRYGGIGEPATVAAKIDSYVGALAAK